MRSNCETLTAALICLRSLPFPIADTRHNLASNEYDQRQSPHRRLNILTGDWILISPQRTKRPWLGKQEAAQPAGRPAYDPKCYLCPGNERAGGLHNPLYENTFVFDNDFAAILPQKGEAGGEGGLLHSQAVSGACRVICFSPRHDLSLAKMAQEGILAVVNVGARQVEELGSTWRWVQIFENKGDVMGCSNPHPHGQVWAGGFLPNEVAKEIGNSFALAKKGRPPALRLSFR